MEQSLLGSPIDKKNIELAKILYSLRHDLNIFRCLIRVNASAIYRSHPGKLFFGHIAMRVLESIVLAVCKIYEDEKRYELNSIQGVLNNLSQTSSSEAIYQAAWKAREAVSGVIMDEATLRAFVARYGGPSEIPDLMIALQATFDQFKKAHSDDLESLKRARDKVIAHSEYQALITSLPSCDTMEQLFDFGAEFYMIVGALFIWFPADPKYCREVKRDLRELLKLIGVPDHKTEIE